MRYWICWSMIALGSVSVAWAKEASVIKLPPPQMTGGKPLLQALHERHSTREFNAQPVSRQVLSNLLWAADGVNRVESGKRMTGSDAEHQVLYSAADTGFIAQNVYLFCASEGLGTVVRGSVDREALAAALGLAPHQTIILAQSVGYPKP